MNANVIVPSSAMSKKTTTSPWSLRESRRGSSRREVVLPCQCVREHDFKLIADRTLDISIEGLLLPLRTRVLTGETLIVSFAIPGMWIDAEATVARVVHGRRPGDDGLAVGVLFDRIPSSARAALAAFLHGRRSPLPRRGPLARLRRGQDAPQLADEALMRDRLAMPDKPDLLSAIDERSEESWVGPPQAIALDFVDAADVIDDDSPQPNAVSERESAAAAKEDVDGLNVLRAVVGAWQSLSLE